MVASMPDLDTAGYNQMTLLFNSHHHGPPQTTTDYHRLPLPLCDSNIIKRDNTNTVGPPPHPSPMLHQQADNTATRSVPRSITILMPPKIEPLYVKQQPPKYDITAGTIKNSN